MNPSLNIHQKAIAIDMHVDTAQRLVDEGIDISKRLPDGHFDTVRMKEGGLDAQFFSIWVEPQYYGLGGKSAIDRADKQIDAVKALAQNYPDTWELALNASDIRRIAAAGKLAALMGLEGGYAIDERLENVERYYNLGVRYMSLAWSVSLSWAGSSGDEIGSTLGLNEFGRAVVNEMNRLGMMIDVSHVSDKTFWDIIDASRKPIIATHSNARAIAHVPRNLDDDQIRAIATNGGVCCVMFYPEFIEPGWRQIRLQVDQELEPLIQREVQSVKNDTVSQKLIRNQIKEKEYARRMPSVILARVVDHMDHIVNIAGIDSVGIGSDFDGILATLKDLSTVADFPNLTVELLRRGYSETDVTKILGGNVLRLMEEVEIQG